MLALADTQTACREVWSSGYVAFVFVERLAARLTTALSQLPPVMNYGSEALKRQVIPDVLAGRKFISLAISEAFAGSDVAGLRCTAKKTPDGKHYIVNGTKKWITKYVPPPLLFLEDSVLTLLLAAVSSRIISPRVSTPETASRCSSSPAAKESRPNRSRLRTLLLQERRTSPLTTSRFRSRTSSARRAREST